MPIGDESAWSIPPFGAEIRDDVLYGRGAADMKSGVAAFCAAAIDFVQTTPPDGAIIITLTGDEEGPAQDGTRAILDWMEQNGEQMTHCLVGEPTCPEQMGRYDENRQARLYQRANHRDWSAGACRLSR